jgi:hypothetical protein
MLFSWQRNGGRVRIKDEKKNDLWRQLMGEVTTSQR